MLQGLKFFSVRKQKEEQHLESKIVPQSISFMPYLEVYTKRGSKFHIFHSFEEPLGTLAFGKQLRGKVPRSVTDRTMNPSVYQSILESNVKPNWVIDRTMIPKTMAEKQKNPEKTKSRCYNGLVKVQQQPNANTVMGPSESCEGT
ncbi:hypothetical protein XENORESO_007752 [Xenotaenia resolanae]|uniref:Uncharacterized protein n=1 Tax=Xenotaenia resolanae TaxID=208358 RepID=A0ABV0W1M8_9TELE